jgi:hypothetical protein
MWTSVETGAAGARGGAGTGLALQHLPELPFVDRRRKFVVEGENASEGLKI